MIISIFRFFTHLPTRQDGVENREKTVYWCSSERYVLHLCVVVAVADLVLLLL